MLKDLSTLQVYFSSFCLNWPRMGFYKPVYKNEPFFLLTLTFQYHLHKIYIYIYIYIYIHEQILMTSMGAETF